MTMMMLSGRAQNLVESLKGRFEGEIRCDVPMSEYTSLRIGGAAEIVVFPEDPLSLREALHVAQEEIMPIFIFGGGTNLIVSDRGVKGLGISLKEFKRIESVRGGDEGEAVLFVEAGVQLGRLLNYTVRHGYSGLEGLAGIPGMLGGAVYMNAGSFGTEIKDVIISVVLMDLQGNVTVRPRKEIPFSYRCSQIAGDMIIMSANIMLSKDDPGIVGRRIRDFLGMRRATQPLGEASAGCVFKNPPLARKGTSSDTAGSLIDRAGCKGLRAGDVEVSTEHANYFINRGKATCSDFMELMEMVRSRVEALSGIRLEPEVKIIGEI